MIVTRKWQTNPVYIINELSVSLVLSDSNESSNIKFFGSFINDSAPNIDLPI